MPSAKSTRVAVRKRGRNMPLRTRARSQIRRARSLIDAQDIESAEEAVRAAFVALDKGAQKGALHANNASRRKSRIMKALQKAKAAN